MATIDAWRSNAFIALETTSRAEKKGRTSCSALLYSYQDGAQVARQRCLILRLGETNSTTCPLYNRTFLLRGKQDISTSR